MGNSDSSDGGGSDNSSNDYKNAKDYAECLLTSGGTEVDGMHCALAVARAKKSEQDRKDKERADHYNSSTSHEPNDPDGTERDHP